MVNNLFIIHFQPLEGYPPIMNLLDFFSLKNKFYKITCLSTKGQFKHTYANNKIDIKRKGNANGNKIMIWLTYFFFNISSILSLIIKRPCSVIYYETISSFPVYIYKTFINKNANIFIHFHEYTTKNEYKSSSIIIRLFHHLEKRIFAKTKWISHTNKVRLHNFLTDWNITYNKDVHHVSPNYPSKNWGIKNTSWHSKEQIKLVFVGYSVDSNSSFITELIEWLSEQKIKSSIDIYCLKQNSLSIALLGKTGNTIVNMHKSVSYYALPNIFKKFHIGLILYGGLTPNYIHNAPNKLFEYLACDLDVWFPNEMKGCHPYEKTDGQPKILNLDFNN